MLGHHRGVLRRHIPSSLLLVFPLSSTGQTGLSLVLAGLVERLDGLLLGVSLGLFSVEHVKA